MNLPNLKNKKVGGVLLAVGLFSGSFAVAKTAETTVSSAEASVSETTLHPLDENFIDYTVKAGDTSWGVIVKKFCNGKTDGTSQNKFSKLATNSNNGVVQVGYGIHVSLTNCPPGAFPTTTTTIPTTTTVVTSTSSPSTTSTTTPVTTTTSTTTPVTTTTIADPPPFTLTQAEINALLEPRDTQPAFSNVEGAFRFICMPSHLNYDDPIVYFGQPGRAHLHQYFGNTGANANSTFTSLRTSGNSTCQGGILNRSAYWAPALLNGVGSVINPDLAVVYYKGDPDTVNVPDKLRYIAGDAMGLISDDDLYGTRNAGVVGGYEHHPYWQCIGPDGPLSETIPICPAGTTQVQFSVDFPYCWNGLLDSPNHRSHVVFPKRGNDGQEHCPSTHPTLLPRFTFKVQYTIAGAGDMSKWYVSSDDMYDGTFMPPGSTIHADWFGAWEPSIRDIWGQECVREMRNGNASDYCNGTGGKQPTPWNWVNPVRLSPIPVRQT